MSHFKTLKNELQRYLTKSQIDGVYQAYRYAEKAHRKQKRVTGEPYITHPVAVARILSIIRMDVETLSAALLHDVLEDTETSKAEMANLFGPQVAELVDGVSKLAKIKFETRVEAQAENFRKMILAMSKDIRVILIKLADRLHNMRTLHALSPQKRRRIAAETLEIYAPIANRLGMHIFRVELEELGFAAQYPKRHKILSTTLKKFQGNRRKVIATIEKTLKSSLTRAGVSFSRILGREKRLYSIYKKMLSKRLTFSQIMDLNAFRIIVKDMQACYQALGVVHNLYKPLSERFKDYIAIPKVNGYQALHTTLFGPYGTPIEIQIRSEKMNHLAENGIAAHWIYKAKDTLWSGKENLKDRAQGWLKGLLELQQKTGNSIEFIENVKIDLFPDEVYLFTPKGRILKLPKGATPIDFAYAVHSDIGNACVAAKIDRRLAPLSTELVSGQTIEIITAPTARPSVAWLDFVRTGKARSNIRHVLKRQKSEESIALGKRLLETALGGSVRHIAYTRIQQLLEKRSFNALDDLYESIGVGTDIAMVVARQLTGEEENAETSKAQDVPLEIQGSEGMVVAYAACCKPIPGDPILGVLCSGSGLDIHHAACEKMALVREKRREALASVCWADAVKGEFRSGLLVHVSNQRGVLAALTTAIAHADANIENIQVKHAAETHFNTVEVIVTVRNRQHLARVIRRLRSVRAVLRVHRQMASETKKRA